MGKSTRMVQRYVQTYPSFPEPERTQRGTFFLHDLEQIEVWMRRNQIEPQCDRAEILREVYRPDVYSTTQVLAFLGLKNSKGNRAHLAKRVREGRFPAPLVIQRGRQRENLWEKQQVDDHRKAHRRFAAKRVSQSPDRVILPTGISK